MPVNQTPTLKTQNSRIMARATELCQTLYNTSGQSMYLYLDDHSKTCNGRFAKLLGYSSPDAWAAVTTSFPQAFVAPASQELLVDTYQAAINEGVAGKIPVTWRRKDGKTVDTNVILVPVDIEGHRVALHFIEDA
ncbi:MAG: PAS domain-containing protein [Candidatus Thermoplasmatota archaeon]